MLGYEYPQGYLNDPKNHRTRSSLLLAGPTGNLLVDCTPELRLQMTREKVYDVEAVLISHTHADHVMGMDDLRSLCLKYRRPIPVYTLPEYHDDIRRIFNYAFREIPEGVFVPRFDLHNAPEEFEVGGMQVHTFRVEHGRVHVIGLRVGRFAYITDVSRIPENARAKLDDLDVLVVDAVRRKEHPNHFHLARALEVAAEIGAKRTVLTHLSHDYDHEVTNRELPAGVELAYDGMRFRIPM
jgi:phosphoribosyl 1,2-cyclic phosphate phosphodiesterase